MAKTLKFNDSGTIQRRFTKEWKDSGLINLNKLPQIIESMLSEKDAMIEYIEALHDRIDEFVISLNRT